MFDDLKKLPEAQKLLLKRTVTMTSVMFLVIACLLWFFKAEAMEMLGFDSLTLDIVAGALCVMVAVDLIFVKVLFGEDKAK